MTTREHKAAPGPEPRAVAVAVVTVSDTRVEADDLGGAEAERLIAQAGFSRAARQIVVDDREAIQAVARGLVDRGDVDVVVFTGGTGFSPRDVTVEAMEPLFERRIDGFGELFRMLSFPEVGAAAMLSRATAGVIGNVPMFLTPGSPSGVRLALERLILPELTHLLGQLRRSERPGGGTGGVAASSGQEP